MVELKKSMVKNHQNTVKFLCSYGGKILPRSSDGQLRYVGGVIRVLSVDRSVSFAELLVKLGELCGTSSVILRCQLPTEDLDALISVTSDEDLANIIEEYDIASHASSSTSKIRAFLFPPKSSLKKISPPPSIYSGSPTGIYSLFSSSSSSSSSQPFVGCFGEKMGLSRNHRFCNQISTTTTTTKTPVGYPVGFEKSTGAIMLEQYYYDYISQGSLSPTSRPPPPFAQRLERTLLVNSSLL